MLPSVRDLLRNVIRSYTLYSPVTKGKGRLIESTRRWTVPAGPVIARVGSGYRMQLELRDLIQRNIYFLGYYEPEFSRFLTRVLRKGDTFVDAGANVGQFSIIASFQVGASGRVIAIEPEPGNLSQLKANLELNNITNVSVVGSALGSSERSVNFFVRGEESGFTNRGVHSLHQHDDWLETSTVTTRLQTLDSILDQEEKVNVIKMDIEGGELDALKGATRSLTRFEPLIILEANEVCTRYFGHGTAEVKQWLLDAGFTLGRLRAGRVEAVSPGPEEDAMIVAYTARNKDRLTEFLKT